MKTEIFAICDAATSQSSKLNILGVFDTIHSKSMPAIHPQAVIALRIRFQQEEEGERPFKIVLTDKKGKDLIPPIEGRALFKLKSGNESGTVQLILNLMRIEFQEYGKYEIALYIEGQKINELPLFVKKIV